MKKRISAWMRKQASQTNCAPAVLVIAVAVVCGVIIYEYRHIILMTLAIIGMVLLAGAIVGLAVAIVLGVRKYRTTHPHTAPAVIAPTETLPVDTVPNWPSSEDKAADHILAHTDLESELIELGREK